jgi:hypothetical protein
MKLYILLMLLLIIYGQIFAQTYDYPMRYNNDYLQVSVKLQDTIYVVRDSFYLYEPVYYELSIRNISDHSIPYRRSSETQDLFTSIVKPTNQAEVEAGDVNPVTLDRQMMLEPGELIYSRKPVIVTKPGSYTIVVYPAFYFDPKYWPGGYTLSRKFVLGGPRTEVRHRRWWQFYAK